MRLIIDEGYGDLSLVEYDDHSIPRYAILSHTWGADSEEVTFKDLMEGTGKDKVGYTKIEFCRKQAISDGLQHFWVDTCCIDKSSSTELTEAINSMFRWYQNAFRCYVYMSDVSTLGHATNYQLSQAPWEAAFRRSRWFSRGWTLQELIAPASVEFFSCEGGRLGSKRSLEQHIHDRTGIPIRAIRTESLETFDVEERLSWANHRDTRRQEDKAYSLLGIFNVHMPLLYGEGRDNAFLRLRETIGKSSKHMWGSYAESTPFTRLGKAFTATGKLPAVVGFGLNLSRAPQITEGMFVGRQAEVIQLDQWLRPRSTVPSQRIAAIVGLGGLGKTQLSVTFAKQHHEKYSSVFWLNAKDELALKQDFVHLSKIIQIDQGSGGTGPVDEDLVIQQVLRWLSRPENNQWLLIFDNYDDPRLPGVKSATGYDIRRYFPSRSQGSILVTTRSHRLTFARQLELAKLEKLNESIEILSSRSDRDLSNDPAASILAQRLDGLPLALATAGSYLRQSAESVDEYLYTYEEYWHELDDTAEELVEYEDRTLFSTWNLSLAHVRAQWPEVAELPRLLAYFGNKGVTYNLLQAGNEFGLKWLSSLTINQRQFSHAMARLYDYSLVEKAEGSYYLHTCVHDWILQALNRDVHRPYFWLAVHCVACGVKSESERDYWQTNHQLTQHAIQLEHRRFRDILDSEDLSKSQCDDLRSLGDLWSYQDEFLRSERMYQRALTGYEKVLGPNRKSTLDTVNNLGLLYWKQGMIAEAEEMYQRALTGYEEVLGPDHSSTLDTVNNLGLLYRNQGKLVEAEEMYQRALAGYEKALGADHSSALNTVNNLGLLYRDQGKLAEAEKMYQRALAGKEKALGPDHTSTLSTVNNLGSLYNDQGKMVEAEEMYQRALAGKEKALGPDHRLTLNTVHNLGSLYRDQGKMVEAEEMYQRALAGYEQGLGPDHTSTLSTVNNLGSLYRDQGKMVEAEEMYQRALVGYEQGLGPDHTSTLSAVNNLGSLYRNQGKMVEAEEMYQRALVGYEKALGPDHTSTLNTVNNLGSLYRSQRKMVEAEEMYQRALEGKEKALGPDHTSTLDTVNNLGSLYRDQGMMAKAEEMYQRALAGYEQGLGPDHTSTLSTVNNLGSLYRDQGKMVEAEEMYRRALAGYEKALGPDHTSTLSIVNNLGLLYSDQGKMAEAEEMYERALAGYEKAFGPEHPWTLSTVRNLGQSYKIQGKLPSLVKLMHIQGERAGNLWGVLARALMSFLDDLNAQTAFGQEVQLIQGSIVYSNVVCGACECPLTCATKRFVCKDCIDGDLCGECHEKHRTGLKTMSMCLDHSFLEISSEDISLSGELDRDAWLQDLMTKYNEKQDVDPHNTAGVMLAGY